MKNGVMIQYFEWHYPADGSLWKKIKEDASHLREIGITSVWIPPAYKGNSDQDVGYGAYDLYDLGEFDQKGTVRTKYGTRRELQEAIEELHNNNIEVYLDAVMNHKAGADFTEKVKVKKVDPSQRDKIISNDFEIEACTGFEFAARGDKYSDFKWHWYHFTGTDTNMADNSHDIFLFDGKDKSWNDGVDNENGNYDYLMYTDIDYDHPEVIEEMSHWGVWVSRVLNLDGMRLDAIKHINDKYIKHFLQTIRDVRGENFYAVGEYWKNDIESLEKYLGEVDYSINLFDVPLHYKMFQASDLGEKYDLTDLLDNTLVSRNPTLAVTFVDNHDSQWGSSLESQVKTWFKPLAYGLILLMEHGYPCIFYGDYYSINGTESPHRPIIDLLLGARRKYAYREQKNYFDHPNTVGFIRLGDDHPDSGLALLISNGKDGDKLMNVGESRKNEVWHEITSSIADEVTIDENGNGHFTVKGGKLALWVKK